MVSAHLTMIEGSRVSVLEAFDFLLGAVPTLGPGKPLAGYDMLGDHARALDLALERADAQLLPGPALLRELTGAVVRSTGRVTNTALGTVDLTQGDLRRVTCSSRGPASSLMPKRCRPSWRRLPASCASGCRRPRRCGSSWNWPSRLPSAWSASTPLTTATGAPPGCS